VNSGKFEKNNKAAVKKKKHKSSYSFSASAHNIQLPAEDKTTDVINTDFIKFGFDNLFPQRMSELNRKSAVSRAIIKSKRNYVVGRGFETENEKFNNWEPNPDESLRQILSKLSDDKLNDGNAYYEVVKTSDGNDVNFFHIDSTTVRYSVDREHVILHPDWTKYDSHKELAKVRPLYPDFEAHDGNLRSVVHIKDYEREFSHYGIPSNIGGIDSANINYKTNKWNLSRLENAFNTSGILMLQADFSKEDADSFDEDFEKKFVGEGNQGKLIKIVNEIGSEPNASKYIPIETNEDGSWQELHDQATKELITANQWFAGLSGLPTAQGLSADSVLRNEYQLAITGPIVNEQEPFIESFTKVLNEQANFGIDDLSIINKSPVALIDLDAVHEAIIAINTEVSEGRMRPEVAKSTLKISFQMTDEQVNELF
jgi:hypothetical protein